MLKQQPVGQLAAIIEDFIIFKRSQGCKYLIEENILHRFSVFSTKYSIKGKVIPSDMLTAWFEAVPGERNSTRLTRCVSTYAFLRYAMDYGYKANLPEFPRIKREEYIPYIFTKEELRSFFKACDSLSAYPGSHRHEIVPVIFRLLYGCGLRASEAAALRIGDVDLEHGVLTIREPKNRQDRYVPMSASVCKAMKWFHHHAHSPDLENDAYFFRGKYNDHITRHRIYKWFRLCLRKAGISHSGKGHGPREHDLRHSFCVHSLGQLYKSGRDIYSDLPILSVYIGHKSIAATQSYLRLTAEMYPDICSRMEDFAQIIPQTTEGFNHAE
ncbi:tyrosine-type recombinase/integrase [uncultured Victivallis sp.]|uniref:tyrosine-type recombinase/integrase n=1 Tax=uncultured Victivallis sp. TaxID=354118 RepID=UPI002593BEB3|nr:tyrosine-type recombinase/integrase [uncultured Victivallis sp.]